MLDPILPIAADRQVPDSTPPQQLHLVPPVAAAPPLSVALEQRQRIDEILDFTLEEAHAHRFSGAFGKCADYAIIGARVLSTLFDHPFTPVSGGEIIDCGDESYIVMFPRRDARRNARQLSDLLQYHCWIQSDHAQADGSQRSEVIDFTVRHDKVTAHAMKMGFTRFPEEKFVWTWSEDLDLEIPPSLRQHPALKGRAKGWLWTDPDCTRLLRKYELDHEAFLGRMTKLVLQRLEDNFDPSLSAQETFTTALPQFLMPAEPSASNSYVPVIPGLKRKALATFS